MPKTKKKVEPKLWKTVTVQTGGFPKDLKLTTLTPTDLGFKDGVSRAGFFREALSLNLSLCPSTMPEVLEDVGLNNDELPHGRLLRVATRHISGQEGFAASILSRGERNNIRLIVERPEGHCYRNDRWIFVLPDDPK